MSPNQNSQSHENPYAVYTQNAQNWENERLTAIRRENERRDFQRMQEEEARQRRQERIAQEQRAERKKAQAKNTQKSISKPSSAQRGPSISNQASFKEVITVITFLVGAIYFYGVFKENLIGTGIAAAISAVIIRHTYKFILTVAVIIFLIMVFAQA